MDYFYQDFPDTGPGEPPSLVVRQLFEGYQLSGHEV